MFAKLATIALLASQALAHYTLNFPPTIQPFNEDGESSGPCGGYTPNLNNLTYNFKVGGDTILLNGLHPTITYIVRGTLDGTGKTGWQQLIPIDQVTGVGLFCHPQVPAPASFAGKPGIIQVIADSPDGILYQCASVNFVTGANTDNTANGCKNASGVTASYTNDALFASLNSNASTVGSSSPSSSSSGSSPAASTSKAAAAGQLAPLGYGAIGSIAIGVVGMMCGAFTLL